MAEPVIGDPATAERQRFARMTNLLGGLRVLRRQPRSRLDAHEMILQGLPGAALTHLVERHAIFREPGSLEKAIGISLRTFQRHRDSPSKPLSQEQSGRVWKFTEVMAKAAAVLGSEDEAEQWLVRPAMGLEHRRPIDLLATPEGTKLVEEFLERLEYGVYV